MSRINRRKFLRHSAVIAISSAATAFSGRVAALQHTDADLHALTNSTSVADIPLRHRDKLQKIYSQRNYVPLWTKQGQVTQTARAVIKRLENASLLGLYPSNYYPKVLNKWVQDPNFNPQLEMVLTDSLWEYFDNLANGQTNEIPGDPAVWFARQSHTDIDYNAMDFFNGNASFGATIDRLQPVSQNYTNLLMALRDHYQILAQGGYTPVPQGNGLQPGSVDPRVAKLRARLAQSGDLPAGLSQSDIFDLNVDEAVKHFQQRHGLEADGVIGSKTLAELNVPVQQRIAQIEINLDRWRWLPRDLGADHIVVNSAGFEMDVTLHNHRAIKMGVVVGKRKHRTPVFSDEMEHIVFRPSWNVPKSIAAKELLPKELENPGHLDSRDFVVVSRADQSSRPVSSLATHELEPSYFNSTYRLRQKPGQINALGSVKFMFPNKHSIYLHDTNARHLFGKIKRAFSHGCIRVEDPDLLARTLLQNDGKDEYEIDSILSDNSPKTVVLGDKIPVHLTYQTSWVDDTGRVQFRADIYDHDKYAIGNYRSSRPEQANQESYVLSSLDF